MTEASGATTARDSRRDFVEGIVPLSLWLARRLSRDGLGLREAVTTRTDVYRLTTLWDGRHHPARPAEGWRDARWEALLDALEALFREHDGEDDTAALERAGLQLLWPVLEPRIERDAASRPRPENRPYGFFNYDARPEEQSITLHLANPFAPRSPFEEPAARAAELTRLLTDAGAVVPGLRRVRCGSWLNSFPPFQALFPPSWTASASEPTPLHHTYGWWGQLIDRRGGFHARHGAVLRETGRFPYPCVICACGAEELRTHLEGLLRREPVRRARRD